MKYCKKCLMPDTRPGIQFDDNDVCYPCINYENQKNIDWTNRFDKLKTLCDKHRGINGNGYDCAIAISGGKDSHFQVYYMKEVLKMNPVLLAVGNVDWTEEGRKNLENISDVFGCDVIQLQPNLRVTRILARKTFEEFGQPSWYTDSLIYAYPYRMAIQLGVKLLVYGENVNYTYGGATNEDTSSAMLQPYNGVVQDFLKDWLEDGGLTEKDLVYTRPPSIEDCKKFNLEPIYLGYFIPWNSIHNYQVAKRWGFKHLQHEHIREGFLENYDQIDSLSYLLNIHLKYLKFGHANATDTASRWIRYGIKTREEMIPIVEENDGELDQVVVENFCKFTGFSIREFWKILDKWYNKDFFEQDKDGIWHPKFNVGIGLN